MFTGLIEELGEISALRRSGCTMRLEVAADGVFDDLEIGNSISIDGVCQTVVSLNGKRFTVEAVEETLRRTTFVELQRGDLVNLERPLKASGRLGGHMVQGHVDGVGTIKRLEVLKGSWILHVEPPPPLRLYIAPKGAIAVDGIHVNMVSHGHGQGYADLHIILPEVVEKVEVKKGPYFAEFGNLATAGALAYHTRDHLQGNTIALEGGSFSTAKYTMLYQIPLALSLIHI